MHELTVVMNIIDIAKKELEEACLNKIEVVELEIGELSGIEMTAFDFAWQVSINNTILENSFRKIILTKGKAKCRECGNVFLTNSFYNACPNCKGLYSEIIRGKELRVKSITAS